MKTKGRGTSWASRRVYPGGRIPAGMNPHSQQDKEEPFP
jgi:hypothetical protein